jgi:hypothetical protein
VKIRIVKNNKQVINEAMKGPDQLPANYVVMINDGGTFVEVSYKALYSNPSSERVYGELVAEEMSTATCVDKTYEVMSSEAAKGWGPMLYDVMMEYLTNRKKASLTSDRGMVSTAAKNVWDFYLNNRSDVEKIRMDISDDSLDFIYGSKRMAPFKQLTPNDKSDDCTQDTAVYWAVGKGDWKKHNSNSARMAAIDYPKRAANWHKQSVSYAYVKNNKEVMNALTLKQQIKYEFEQ